MRTRRTESGTALVEAVWLVVLLLVPLVYLLVSVSEVQRASYALSGAARAAARAYSLASDEAGAPERARIAARLALADHDIELADVAFGVQCRPVAQDCLAPGGTITVDLRHQVVLPLVPEALGGGAPSFRVEAAHTVAYGSYREGR